MSLELPATPPRVECPDEEVLLELAAGTLDPARATPLEQHLATCPDCCAVLAEAAQEPVLTPTIPMPVPDVTPESEGRYQLRRELGEGAEGRVFAAWDHHLAREVALKIPHADATTRPLREARLVARLDHPGIATVFEIGQRADGSLYSVQRLVHAEHGPRSLRQAIDEAPTLNARLRLLPRLLQVCEAVGYAHARGVVHRDLKPQNIALGDGGETVVLDWGLAIQLDEQHEGPRRVGTRGYVSPEQARGDLVGPPTDVFSLGVMLDELLAPAPPGERPRPLVAIAQQARAEDPAQRYATASEMAADLTAWLSGGVVQAHDYALSELLARNFRRHRQAIFFLGLVALVAIGAALLIARSRRHAEAAFATSLLQKAAASQALGAWDEAAAYSAAARELSDSEAARVSLAATQRRSLITARRTLSSTGPVAALAWFGPQKLLAAGLADGGIVLVRSGSVLRTLQGESRACSSALKFSPDGAHLFTTTTDGRLTEWDLATGTSRVLATHRDALNALIVDPQGQWLATGGEDGFVELFTLPGGTPGARWKAHASPIYALETRGPRLVTGAWDTLVKVWTLDGQPQGTLEGHADAVQSLALSPDGTHLASASRDGSVRVWPFPDGGTAQVLAGHTRKVSAVAWLDEGHLASTGDDGQIRSWAMRGNGPRSWQCVGLEKLDEAGTSLIALPNGGSVVGGSRGALVLIAAPRVMALQLPWRERVSHLDVDDGGVLMIEPGAFVWRDLQTDQIVAREATPTIQPAQARVLPGGRRLWAGYHLDKTAALYLRDAEGHDTAIAPLERVWSLSLDPDAKWAAALGGSPTLQLYSTVDGDAGVTLGGHESDIFAAALGRTVAVTASYDQTLGVFALPSGERLHTLRGHWHGVRAVALSPDESLIASGSWDQTVRLWNRETGALEATLHGHQSYVTAVAFSPSGRRLASVSWDGTLRVWDVASRSLLLQQDHVENEPRAVQWFGDDVLRIGGTRMQRVDLLPELDSGLAELERRRGVHFEGAMATRVDFGRWD